MWMLQNFSRFACERSWTRDADGRHHWIVAVRCGFDVRPDGSLERREQQDPPSFAPEYQGEDGGSSLRQDTELTLSKPGTDVVVVGTAHAPGGKPVPQFPIALRIGALEKVLIARGPNAFTRAAGILETTDALPCTSVPVRYEQAFGGSDLEAADPQKQRMDLRNPLGVGVAAEASRIEGTRGPQIVYPGRELDTPAGFGAIASHWTPRREWGGTYGAKWVEEQKPLLARDFDARHLLSAPEDQRTGGFVEAGTRIEVVHMTRSGALRFQIPALRFEFKTKIGPRITTHHGRLVTVLVDTDEEAAHLTWQTTLPVPHNRIDDLDQTLVMERA